MIAGMVQGYSISSLGEIFSGIFLFPHMFIQAFTDYWSVKTSGQLGQVLNSWIL